jgi:hypothetical protein
MCMPSILPAFIFRLVFVPKALTLNRGTGTLQWPLMFCRIVICRPANHPKEAVTPSKIIKFACQNELNHQRRTRIQSVNFLSERLIATFLRKLPHRPSQRRICAIARHQRRNNKETIMSDPSSHTSSLPAVVQPRRHPLRNRAFRSLWIGNTISWTGDQFYLVALPWLVLSLTDSSIVLGTISMLAAIPRAVLMLLGGAVSDHVSPRRILMLTALGRALLVGAVATLLFLRRLHLWELYFLALGFGGADAFAYPAGSALLPSIVEPEQLPAANAVSQSTLQITTLLAPGPAGLFIRAFGNAWAFLLDALSFLAILVALVRLPDPPAPSTSTQHKSMMHSIVEGLRYVNADISLRSLMLVIAVLNFALVGPLSIGLAVIAKHNFGTASAFGLLMSSFAAGSLIGMLCAGFVPHRRRGRTLLLASTVIGLCVAPLGLLTRISTLVPDLLTMSCVAAFLNIQLIAWFQQRVDRALMGRVMSVLMFASVGLAPLSLAFTGLALKANILATFLAAGAMVLIVTLLAASHRVVREID